MNKKGITPLITIPIAVVVIILALALAPSVKTFVDGSRNQTDLVGGNGLDCSNSSISDYDQAACVSTDLFIPGFIGALIGLAIILIGARVVFIE